MAAFKQAFSTAALTAAGAVLALGAATSQAEDARVIALTQTGCQFLEPEGSDHQYQTTGKADCDAINARTGDERVARSRVLELKPGKYVFRVTNKNVPYDLGFWLREADYNWLNPVHKATKLSVSGGGLSTGTSQDYEAELKPGEYFYSCPLNPTPNYRIVVSEG